MSPDGRESAFNRLSRQLEGFGLSIPAARVLIALLQAGTARASELARVAGINRTSTYQMLDALKARQLADQLPGKFALWSSPGSDEVLSRLLASEEDRLKRLHDGLEDIRAGLTALMPDEAPVTLSPIQLLANAALIRRTFRQLTNEARSEILIMHLPPYAFARGSVTREGMEALRRGVHCRALYQAADLGGPDAEPFRREHETYMAAGLEGRVISELPTKLAIFDRHRALLTTRQQAVGDYPTTLLIDDQGCSMALAHSFDHCWASGNPYRAADFVNPLTA